MLRFAVLALLALGISAQSQNFRARTSFPQSNSHFTQHHPFNRRNNFNNNWQRPVDFTRRETWPENWDKPVVPEEYVDAHQTFSVDLLKHPYYTQTVEKHGVVSVSPFSLGHFLAIINERSWNVPTTQIPKILHLNGAERVNEAYSLLTDAHEDDHKSYQTSWIWTPNEKLPWTNGLHKLDTHKQVLKFHENAPEIINNHIRVATHDKLVAALLPNDPLLDPENTKAVVVDTHHYINHWDNEFLYVGRKQFQSPSRTVDVDTLEVIGHFPTYEHQHFWAVALPLESHGEDKHAVFVLPKTNLRQYLNGEGVEWVFKLKPTDWTHKTVRIQLPKVNVTFAHNVEQYIASENIVCAKDKPDQLHPIVQVTNLIIDDDEVSYAVATGAQVTTVNNERNFNNVARNFVPRQNNQASSTLQYKWEYVPATKDNYLTLNELIFNKPFFTYFFDTTYGPWGYTALSHVFDTTLPHTLVQTRDSPFDFSDAVKHDRFTCEGQHN